MRKLLLAALVPLAACGNAGRGEDGPSLAAQGSGSTRSYAASDFSKVDLAGSDDVDVRVGSGFSVRAEGEPAVLERLRIWRDGDTLTIGRKRGVHWQQGKARVLVTMPRIAAGTISGSGNMAVDRVEGSRFDGSVAGSGTLSLGTLAVETANFSIAGSGDIVAAGTARRLESATAGSGDLRASGLAASGAKIEIAGSGSATAAVNGTAEVSLLGSGDVDLGAGARCRVEKMGSGRVRCGG